MAYIERLADHHCTGMFSSGTPLLDDFLRNEAYQEDKDYGITWVVVPERGSTEVLAFYTLLYPYELAEEDGMVLALPAIELLCLAVDTKYQKAGIGTKIIRGVVDRVLESLDEYPVELLLLVAISGKVRTWYLSRELGFRSAESPADRMTLYATINDMRQKRDTDPQWLAKCYTLPSFFWPLT